MTAAKLNIPKAQSDTWETPADVFDQLDQRFGPFTFDPACSLDDYSALKILARGGQVCIPPPWPGTVNMPTFNKDVYSHIRGDGLNQPWKLTHARCVHPEKQDSPARVWLNPPYGAGLKVWVPLAVEEVEKGNAELVCALLPSYTGPKWWQEHIFRQVRWEPGHTLGQEWIEDQWVVGAHPLLYQLDMLPGRISFVGAPGPAAFDSAVVVWKKR